MKTEPAASPSTRPPSNAYWSASVAVITTLPRPSNRSPVPMLPPALIPRAKAPLLQQSSISTWRRERHSRISSLTKSAETEVDRGR